MLLTLLNNRSGVLEPDTGSFSYQGNPVITVAGEFLFSEKGEFQLTPNDVQLTQSIQILAESSSYQYTFGNVTDIVESYLRPELGIFSFDGIDTSETVVRGISVDPASFLLTGYAVEEGRFVHLDPEKGEFLTSGYPIAVGMSAQLFPDQGIFVVDGKDIRIDYRVGQGNKKSALYGVRNAIIDFYVPTSEAVQDPNTGNYVVVDATIRYELYLRKAVRDERRNYPGVDRLGATYDGYAVYPSQLDTRIKSGTKAKLKFGKSDEYRDCVVRDARFQFSSLGTIGGALSSALGDSLLLESTWQN